VTLPAFARLIGRLFSNSDEAIPKHTSKAKDTTTIKAMISRPVEEILSGQYALSSSLRVRVFGPLHLAE